MRGRGTDPLRIPDEFWTRVDVVDALCRRDIGEFVTLVRRHTGAGQTKIGAAVGLSQGTISDIMRGRRYVTHYDVLERIASGLDMPPSARHALGLATGEQPDGRPTSNQNPHRTATATTERLTSDAIMVRRSSVAIDHDDGTSDTADEDVDRRDTLRLAGSAVPAVLGSGLVARIAHALTPYGLDTASPEDQPWTPAQLAEATAAAKRSYQACRYASTLDQIPALLGALPAARAVAQGDERLEVEAHAAGAYQVVGSVMLKLGDVALATLAADRSMGAAVRSQRPLMAAASARLVTHALMRAGHPTRAKEIASSAAQRLDRDLPITSPEAISVYGALVLRGAIAAARAEDRTAAAELLDEADEAGRRLERDDNAQWTAFGPTNVQLHRVNVAVLLGDAGTAIDLAKKVDVRRITVAERRASLFIDMANAYAQWGKPEQAYHALATAARTAPEEFQTRPTVRRLVHDLAQRTPGAMGHKARALAHRIGLRP